MSVRARFSKNSKAARIILIAVTAMGLFASHAQADSHDNDELPAWLRSVTISGDVRYRHDYIDEELKETRSRHRLRARFSLKAKASENFAVGFRLAGGSSSPTSTNQTFDGGFSSKSIFLDRAYIIWTPRTFPQLSVSGGKIANPLFRPGKNELIWDSDVNFEGVATTFSGESSKIKGGVTTGMFWVEENSSAKDSRLWVAQGHLKMKSSEKKTFLTFGGGYYYYENSLGAKPFFDEDNNFGNTLNTFGNYMFAYELIEGFVELGGEIEGTPITVFADFVTNTAADTLKNAWLAGIKIGKTKKVWSWSLGYNYRDLENDAVVGAFTNSDFTEGGTGGQGHVGYFALQVDNNATLELKYLNNDLSQSNSLNFKRIEVDLQLKF